MLNGKRDRRKRSRGTVGQDKLTKNPRCLQPSALGKELQQLKWLKKVQTHRIMRKVKDHKEAQDSAGMALDNPNILKKKQRRNLRKRN